MKLSGVSSVSSIKFRTFQSAGFSNEMLEILLFALEDLRKLLKEQGSNLMIRTGNAENVIRNLVQQVVNAFSSLSVI